MDLYSIKMRANRNNNGIPEHISGAEKIVYEQEIEYYTSQIVNRALNHSKGKVENINIKVELLQKNKIKYLKALPVTTIISDTVENGWNSILEILSKLGISNGKDILNMLSQTYSMRGAMLLNVNNLERLEPDFARGIRATYMDYAHSPNEKFSCIKSDSENIHFNEALVLATKVVSHPDIIAEICFSDDPNYIKGYIASKKFGYVRVTKLKEYGSPNGGRIFLYNGSNEDVNECINYIEKQPVLIVK